MKIPFNEDLRPDTGLYNAKLGIWLFLASEVMLFGALFSSYIILRTGDPTWMLHVKEAHLNIPLATINTVVLILSSVTFVMSWVSLKLKDFIVAKIVSVERHPDADKLSLCMVDIGKEIVQVVCGAPNAKKNLISIYAPIGSVIPETKLKIKKLNYNLLGSEILEQKLNLFGTSQEQRMAGLLKY